MRKPVDYLQLGWILASNSEAGRAQFEVRMYRRSGMRVFELILSTHSAELREHHRKLYSSYLTSPEFAPRRCSTAHNVECKASGQQPVGKDDDEWGDLNQEWTLATRTSFSLSRITKSRRRGTGGVIVVGTLVEFKRWETRTGN